jgi:hypothetical protein
MLQTVVAALRVTQLPHARVPDALQRINVAA